MIELKYNDSFVNRDFSTPGNNFFGHQSRLKYKTLFRHLRNSYYFLSLFEKSLSEEGKKKKEKRSLVDRIPAPAPNWICLRYLLSTY